MTLGTGGAGTGQRRRSCQPGKVPETLPLTVLRRLSFIPITRHACGSSSIPGSWRPDGDCVRHDPCPHGAQAWQGDGPRGQKCLNTGQEQGTSQEHAHHQEHGPG